MASPVDGPRAPHQSLIEGAYRHRLIDHAAPLVDDDEVGALARAAIETCHRIEADLTVEIADLRPRLEAAGIQIVDTEPTDARQNHTITFRVPDARTGEQAVEALRPFGFEGWERWSGGARESFRRSADQVTAARTDDVTTVVRFRWRERRHRSRIDRIITPTAGDWHLVDLPRWAWWCYPGVRLVRLASERLGLRPRHRASLGPFLSTPDSLLDPLFDHVAVTADDVLFDLGAGDGRVVTAAASRFGCRAVGVEQDPELVRRGRERIAEAGVDASAEMLRGDARNADLGAATVVVVFLPIDVVADLFDDLLARLSPGTRVLVHEQSRLPSSLRPDSSTLLVGENAVTVAHVWRTPGGSK